MAGLKWLLKKFGTKVRAAAVRRWRTWCPAREQVRRVRFRSRLWLLPPCSSRIRAIRQFRVHAPHRSSSVGCRPREFCPRAPGWRLSGQGHDENLWRLTSSRWGMQLCGSSQTARLANVMFGRGQSHACSVPDVFQERQYPSSAPSRAVIHAGQHLS